MRPRAVGGLEPDDDDQHELHELWRVSLTALSGTSPTRMSRVDWCVGEFLKAHPDAGRKWVYVWSQDHLGVMVPGLPTERNRRRRL